MFINLFLFLCFIKALESEKSSTQGTESLGVYSHRIIQTLKDLRACAESSQNGPKGKV